MKFENSQDPGKNPIRLIFKRLTSPENHTFNDFKGCLVNVLIFVVLEIPRSSRTQCTAGSTSTPPTNKHKKETEKGSFSRKADELIRNYKIHIVQKRCHVTTCFNHANTVDTCSPLMLAI